MRGCVVNAHPRRLVADNGVGAVAGLDGVENWAIGLGLDRDARVLRRYDEQVRIGAVGDRIGLPDLQGAAVQTLPRAAIRQRAGAQVNAAVAPHQEIAVWLHDKDARVGMGSRVARICAG